MTFAVKNLTPVGGQSMRGRAPQVWGYRTADALSAVDASGYFNSVAYNLEPGDIIHVTVVDDVADVGALVEFGTLVVASSAAGVVDTFNARNHGLVALTLYLIPIGTAGQIYGVSPIAGNIVAAWTVINAAITNAGETLTLKAPDGTVGTFTVAVSGSAAGVVDTLNLAPANTEVEAGEAIELETAGDSTGTGAVVCTVLIAPKGTDSD